MAKETIEVLIVGGKATAAPPLGPALGPMKVNIGQVVADINKKTAPMAGMQVPVKVIVDTETKEYTISIGTPPAAALIKQEAGVKKAAGNPLTDVAGNITIDQVKKVAEMKSEALLGKNIKQKVKEILGSCRSMGMNVEGKKAQEVIAEVNAGKYDDKLN